MKKLWITMITTSALAAGLAMAQAPAPAVAPAAAPVRARMQKRFLKSLDLTAAQKQQAKTIRQNTHQQAQPVTQQIQQERQSLKAAVEANDTAKIQQVSTALGTMQGQALAIRSAGKAQFFALLTPDQKAKAAAFQGKAR